MLEIVHDVHEKVDGAATIDLRKSSGMSPKLVVVVVGVPSGHCIPYRGKVSLHRVESPEQLRLLLDEKAIDLVVLRSSLSSGDHSAALGVCERAGVPCMLS
jgi:hypothetical protein